MSICTNFEGALMKAIRSLEQHVDCLMSYDFTGLSYTGLVKELEIVEICVSGVLQRLCAAVSHMS